MVTFSMCLQDWISSYPTGACLEDENGKVIDSEYCDTKEEFIEFAKKHKNKFDEDTQIAVCVKLCDVEYVADFAMEVINEIKKEVEREQD